MSKMGLWLIIYNISRTQEDEYLQWFHSTHISEKLARPGYDWAAHYRVDHRETATGAAQDDCTFVAIFGSSSTRAFYDPSPAQLKPMQDDLTRKMIACRKEVRMMILANEWDDAGLSSGAPSGAPWGSDGASAAIHLQLFANDMDDQRLAAFCAQDYFPALDALPACQRVTKLLASTGVARHVVLQSYDSLEKCHEAQSKMASKNDWKTGADVPQPEYQVSAVRCWPSV